MNHPEAAGLMRDVLDHPADDWPRLIFADWLDEHDQEELAEFIRLQIECARLDAAGHTPVPWAWHPRKDCPKQYEPDGCEECSTMIGRWKRMTALFSIRGDRWLADLHGMIDGPLLSCAGLDDSDTPNYPAMFAIRRGFVAEVRCPLQTWLDHGPAIVRAHPVERVATTDREPADYGDMAFDGWRYGWEWRNGTWKRYRWGLPTAVFNALLENCYHSPDAFLDGADPETLFFRTEQSAIDALALALPAWARLQP